MDLAQHLRTIWRRKWLVLAVAAAVGGLVYAYTRTLHKVYTSSALLNVTPGQAAVQGGTQQDSVFLAATYARMAETRPIVAKAVKAAALRIPVLDAQGRISAAASSDLGFLVVKAKGSTPTEARRLAAAEADALIDAVARQQAEALQRDLARLGPQLAAVEARLRQLNPNDPKRVSVEALYSTLIQQRTQRELQPINRLAVIQEAGLPTAPTSPRPVRNAALAFLVALIVNAELWALLEALSDRFRPGNVLEDVRSATELPILAEIPRGDGPEALEAFRTLRTNLLFLSSQAGVRTIAVVGDELGTGKSHVAIRLAQAAADLELQVVLVDGDLRRPVIHDRLGLVRSPGIAEMRSTPDLDHITQTAEPHLRVLTAGDPVNDPVGRLGGELQRVFEFFADTDLVIVDTPAAGHFADASAIAAHCDATLVIVDPRSTHRRRLTRLIETLRRLGANPIGIILNRVDLTPRRPYYYYSARQTS